ncbi:MAG: zinc ribbon domain-containing protein [Eubacteriales bacterium]
MFCSKCGREMPDNYPTCPDCGERFEKNMPVVKQPKKKKKGCTIVLILLGTPILLFVIFIIVGNMINSSNTASTIPETTLSEEAFELSCISVTYDQLARYPDLYKNTNVKIKGQVIQVITGGDTTGYRVNVTDEGYGLWDDTILMSFNLSEDSPQILEEDIITIYGVYQGTTTYTTIFGAKETVPSMLAEYISF